MGYAKIPEEGRIEDKELERCAAGKNLEQQKVFKKHADANEELPHLFRTDLCSSFSCHFLGYDLAWVQESQLGVAKDPTF